MKNIESELKSCIKNAKATADRDGYPQIVYKDKDDNTYCFHRLFTGVNLFTTTPENIMGVVTHDYHTGDDGYLYLYTDFISMDKQPETISQMIESYKVTF